MSVYSDTSFLVSLYTLDSNSEAASKWLRDKDAVIHYTSFNRLELRNAVRLRASRDEIEWSIAREAIRQIEADLKDGILAHAPMNWTEICKQADELSEKFPGCRTLDLIHVASAVLLKAKIFLSFDGRQKVLAKKAGLNVAP